MMSKKELIEVALEMSADRADMFYPDEDLVKELTSKTYSDLIDIVYA